jgi:metaxin
LGNKRSKSTILVSFLSNRISNYFHVFLSLGSKPKKQPKRERTEEEKTFRRRARYFLVTQVVAVLVFLSVMSSNDFSEVEVDDDDDDDVDEGFSYD